MFKWLACGAMLMLLAVLGLVVLVVHRFLDGPQ